MKLPPPELRSKESASAFSLFFAPCSNQAEPPQSKTAPNETFILGRLCFSLSFFYSDDPLVLVLAGDGKDDPFGDIDRVVPDALKVHGDHHQL